MVVSIDKREWRLLHLHYVCYNNRQMIRQILEQDPALTVYYQWKSAEWQERLQLSSERAHHLLQRLNNQDIKEKIVRFARKYQILTIWSPQFPSYLKQIPDPPLVLYLHGNKSLLQHYPNLSVVGTRYPSRFARQTMQQVLLPLLKKDILLVSGMAAGIDGLAHQLALDNHAKTIAVLGGGFQHIYPQKHTTLFHRLAKQNLIVSEYPPDFSPQKYYFPERNRLISALGFGTLVVEAKEKSGTMITVDQALEQGKEVFAMPGSILTETSNGCNRLIKDGAKLVQDSMDIWIEVPTIPSFS